MAIDSVHDKRVVVFGKRRKIAVTFIRKDGLWRAALMRRPHRTLRVAKDMVRIELAKWHKENCEEVNDYLKDDVRIVVNKPEVASDR